jgi:2-desacetyl-2-hydroxyethyl bacteriochlorophyllide A dehydrogenase
MPWFANDRFFQTTTQRFLKCLINVGTTLVIASILSGMDGARLMESVLVLEAPGMLAFATEVERSLATHEVRIRTLFSGISTGTELTSYRGSNPYLHKRWDSDRRLFVAAEDTHNPYPLIGWGYEQVGEIVEVGAEVNDLSIGQLVYGTWGHRTHAMLAAADAKQRLVSPQVEPILGIFSRIGAIALNGVLDAQINLGETVAVFGLGVVGQIVAQLARLSGAHVVAVDLHASRLDLARRLGADMVIDGRGESPAETIKQLTDGRGADVCIEASGATSALHEATRACAYSAKVIALGFFQGPAQHLFLGEEFHHNRINIVCSQISGVHPSLMYRWDRSRLEQTFMKLAAQGKLQLKPLITHITPFAEAAELFTLLDTRPNDVLQAVLKF